MIEDCKNIIFEIQVVSVLASPHNVEFNCQWLDVPWGNVVSMELSFGTKNDFQQCFDITWRLCVQWLQLKQNHFRYFSYDPGNNFKLKRDISREQNSWEGGGVDIALDFLPPIHCLLAVVS